MDTVYVTTNPTNTPDQYKKCVVDKQFLGQIGDASCKNLYIEGAIYSEDDIQNYIKKLRHGGQLTLSGPDLQEISRCVLTGYLKPSDLRNMLSQGEKLYTAHEITNILTCANLRIIHKRVNNFRYCITAERK